MTLGVGTVALWALLRARPKMWAVAWALMSGCMLMAFWSAVYWREFATMQSQSRPVLQLQSPQWKCDDCLCVGSLDVSGQFSETAIPFVHRRLFEPKSSHEATRATNGGGCNILPISSEKENPAYLAQFPILFRQTDYKPLADPQSAISPDSIYKSHTEAGPTPLDFI